MSYDKKQNKFKTLFIIIGTIGLGTIGFNLYKKRKIDKYKNIDFILFQEELNEILTTDCEYIYKLIKTDCEIIKDGSLNSIFELESLKMMQDLYYKSRYFKFEQTREFAKNLYIYNIKLIEGYLGRLSEDEIIKSSRNLNKSTEKILDVLSANNIDDLYKNCCLDDATILAITSIIKEKMSENCSFIQHILRYDNFIKYK